MAEMTGDLSANASFQETRWSVVAIVRGVPDSPEARRALAELCEGYWYPLYAFARRGGLGVEDAQDATQSFFAKIVRDNLFAAAIPGRGLLRTFLLASFKNHIASDRARAATVRRGGGAEVVPLDFADGEVRYLREPADPVTPETHFDRNWARTVVRSALESLGRHEERDGRGELFAALRGFVIHGEDEAADYAEAAERLKMTVEAARKAVSRLRKRFRECVRREVAATLHSPDNARVEEEMAALQAAMARR